MTSSNTTESLHKNWINVIIEDVVKHRKEKAMPDQLPNAKFIGMDCIAPNATKPSFFYEFSDYKSAGNVFRYGDVLYGRLRPYLNKVYKAEIEGVCSGEFIVLIPSSIIFSKYLLYTLHSKKFVDFANLHVTGERPRISFNKISKYCINLPPHPEQRAIVAKIEQLFSDLDNGINNFKKAQKQLKIYRQAVLKKAFEGDFTGGTKRWACKKMAAVVELIDGDRGPNYPKRNDYLDGGYCLFLSTKNVRPEGFEFNETVYISEEKHNQLRKGTLNRGDIILTTRGTIGNVAYYGESVPFNVIRINSGMLILRIIDELLEPTFLINYIQSPIFILQHKQKKSGTAQPQLPVGTLKEFKIPLPPKDIQQKINDEIARRISICNNIQSTVKDSLQKSEALRQSILKRAFEGKLLSEKELEEARNAPDWEPADKLLERIKVEKEKPGNKK
jgi:type I restriction enzyme S subunit